jgi:hypothetical protein
VLIKASSIFLESANCKRSKMMNFSASLFALFVVAAYFASNVVADSSGNRQCPGGYAHGTQVDMGKYWYACSDGQMVPKGCLSDDGRRVEVGSTFDTPDYRMLCQLGPDGFLTMTYQACVLQGSSHDVGSQWDDGTAFYTCVQQGSNVRVVMLGCVDQGRTLKLDERVAKGDFIYQCKKNTAGTPTMNKVGCIQEGSKYNIGEQFEGPKFWYTCTDSGAKVVGCMYQSHRLVDGDHFNEGDISYVCKVTSDGATLEPYACLAREGNGVAVDRKVGCFWVEGQFEYTCKLDSNNKVAKVPSQCIYRASQGMFKIAPGCVKLAESVAVGCVGSGSGMRIETYPADQIDSLPGLRQC